MCLKMRKGQELVQLDQLTLQNLLADPDSCVEIKQCTHHITLHPFHLGNIAESTKEILNSGISKYHKEFDGILLGYQNVVVLGYEALMSDDTCYMHTNVQADFYLFKPLVEKTLIGTINKKSQDHIGCLVHKLFNVSIPKPYDDDEWLGFKAKVGQEIQLKVTFMSLEARLPYIKGELIAILSEDSGISTSEETTTPRKKKNKVTTFINDEDSDVIEIKADTDSELEEITKKKSERKKKKKLLEENCSDNGDGNEPVIKKKKSKKNKISPELVKEELLNELKGKYTQNLNYLKEKADADSNDTETQTKKKKKSKKEKKEVDILDETLSDLNLEEIFADIPIREEPFKKDMWNGTDIVLPPDSDLEEVLKSIVPPKTKKRKRSIKEEEEISQTPKRPKKSKRKST